MDWSHKEKHIRIGIWKGSMFQAIYILFYILLHISQFVDWVHMDNDINSLQLVNYRHMEICIGIYKSPYLEFSVLCICYNTRKLWLKHWFALAICINIRIFLGSMWMAKHTFCYI